MKSFINLMSLVLAFASPVLAAETVATTEALVAAVRDGKEGTNIQVLPGTYLLLMVGETYGDTHSLVSQGCVIGKRCRVKDNSGRYFAFNLLPAIFHQPFPRLDPGYRS